MIYNSIGCHDYIHYVTEHRLRMNTETNLRVSEILRLNVDIIIYSLEAAGQIGLHFI